MGVAWRRIACSLKSPHPSETSQVLDPASTFVSNTSAPIPAAQGEWTRNWTERHSLLVSKLRRAEDVDGLLDPVDSKVHYTYAGLSPALIRLGATQAMVELAHRDVEHHLERHFCHRNDQDESVIFWRQVRDIHGVKMASIGHLIKDIRRTAAKLSDKHLVYNGAVTLSTAMYPLEGSVSTLIGGFEELRYAARQCSWEMLGKVKWISNMVRKIDHIPGLLLCDITKRLLKNTATLPEIEHFRVYWCFRFWQWLGVSLRYVCIGIRQISLNIQRRNRNGRPESFDPGAACRQGRGTIATPSALEDSVSLTVSVDNARKTFNVLTGHYSKIAWQRIQIDERCGRLERRRDELRKFIVDFGRDIEKRTNLLSGLYSDVETESGLEQRSLNSRLVRKVTSGSPNEPTSFGGTTPTSANKIISQTQISAKHRAMAQKKISPRKSIVAKQKIVAHSSLSGTRPELSKQQKLHTSKQKPFISHTTPTGIQHDNVVRRTQSEVVPRKQSKNLVRPIQSDVVDGRILRENAVRTIQREDLVRRTPSSRHVNSTPQQKTPTRNTRKSYDIVEPLPFLQMDGMHH